MSFNQEMDSKFRRNAVPIGYSTGHDHHAANSRKESGGAHVTLTIRAEVTYSVMQ